MSRRGRRLLGLTESLLAASTLTLCATQATAASEPLPTASAASAGATAALREMSFVADEELILEVRTQDFVLSEGLLAYHRGGRDFLPLGEFARALDLAIVTNAVSRSASGWVLHEDRAFHLDANKGDVSVGGRSFRLDPAEVAVHDGELYVDARSLAQWLPLELVIDNSNLQARLSTREPFPFEARAARARLRGRLGQPAATAEAERETTAYSLFTPPSFDVSLGAGYASVGHGAFEHQIRASGDLLYMNANLYLRGTDGGLLDRRLVLERKDPEGGLPFGATHVAVGDTLSAHLPLGPRADHGRGVFFSSEPLYQTSVFSRTEVRGELAADHEVELFRNGVLIGSQLERDGRYHFADVPLVFGRNELRLVFHGPRGERSEEVRYVQTGDGRLEAGQLTFAASAVQRQTAPIGSTVAEGGAAASDGEWLASARAAFGLTGAVTITAGSAFRTGGEVADGILYGGVRTGVAGVAAAADAALDSQGGVAAQVAAAGEAKGVTYSARHVRYAGGFVDENRSDPEGLYVHSTEVRLDGEIAVADPERIGLAPLNASLIVSADARLDGRSEWRAILRTGASAGPVQIANTLNYVVEGSAEAVSRRGVGDLEVSSLLGFAALRARLEYALSGERLLTGGALQLDGQIDDRTRGRLALTHDLSRGGTSLGFAISREFRNINFGLDGAYGSDGDFRVGLRLSTSIGWSPSERRWFQAPPGLARSGALEAILFEDENGDGLRQADEALVSEGGLSSGGRIATADNRGLVRLTGLPDSRLTSISSAAGLQDPFAVPAWDRIELLPRPGRIHVTTVPVITTAEVEGQVVFAGAAGERALGGVSLQLIGSTGDAVAETRSEFDGYFVFQRVRPGRYRLALSRSEIDRYGLRIADPIEIAVEEDGGLVGGVAVRLTRQEGDHMSAHGSEGA